MLSIKFPLRALTKETRKPCRLSPGTTPINYKYRQDAPNGKIDGVHLMSPSAKIRIA